MNVFRLAHSPTEVALTLAREWTRLGPHKIRHSLKFAGVKNFGAMKAEMSGCVSGRYLFRI
jgi:hypothetical protein